MVAPTYLHKFLSRRARAMPEQDQTCPAPIRRPRVGVAHNLDARIPVLHRILFQHALDPVASLRGEARPGGGFLSLVGRYAAVGGVPQEEHLPPESRTQC